MPGQEETCRHCGLPVGPHPVGSDPYFCCTGCQTVFFVLQESGLADTYYKLQSASADRGASRPADTSRDSLLLAELDSSDFVEQHADAVDEERLRTRLYVNGVHCAACVWLVERLPREFEGVSNARLDLTRSRLTLDWNPRQVRLSQIAEWLSRFGYAIQPRVAGSSDAAESEDRALLVRVGVSWALAANIMLIAFALYSGLDDAVETDLGNAARWISMLLTIPAVVYGAGPFLRKAWASVTDAVSRRSLLHLHMDTPISIGILVGFGHSALATVTGSGQIWFDSIAVLVAALLTARWIQFRSQRIAGDAADQLIALIPRIARKVDADGSIEMLNVSSVSMGDLVEVPPGEVIPVDGVVTSGHSHVDSAILTGESAPVSIHPKSEVWAGTTNLSEPLRISTRAAGEETRVGRLLAWVAGEKTDRAPVTMLADKLSGYFVATVLLLAGLCLAVWIGIDPPSAVSNTVALLVITCPCALGMATPLALAVATGRAARKGIFLKNEAAIQTLTEVDTAVLDKTGTLTHGQMRVTEVVGDHKAVEHAAAVETGNSHPVAAAIRAFTRRSNGRSVEIADDQHVVIGKGVSGRVDGRRVTVGRLDWLTDKADLTSSEIASAETRFADEGATPVAVAIDDQVVTIMALSDELQPEASQLIHDFEQRGIEPVLCSGDHQGTVAKAARDLGISEKSTFSRCSPEDKLAVVSDLTSAGKTVAMIGDGVNDVGALSKAHVGVAVAESAVAGQVSADVFLTGSGIGTVRSLFTGARRVMNIIRLNLGFSLVYNLLGASAALLGFVTPLVAAIAMPISSLVVVISSSVQHPFS